MRRISVPFVLAMFARGAMAQTATIRDSAGIRIVESPSIRTLPVQFRIAARPTWVIGGVRDKPEEELDSRNGYVDAELLSGNRVLVTYHDKLRLFDTTGAVIGTWGRPGSGPGEFRNPQMICRFRGDSVLVWDSGNRRLSVWADGKVAREFSANGAFAFVNGCASDGAVWIVGAPAGQLRPDVPLTTYLLLSGTGSTIGSTPPLPAVMYSGGVMRDADFAASGSPFIFGDEIQLGARVLDRTGKVVQIFRTADKPEPIGADYDVRAMMCTPNQVTHECTAPPTKASTWPAYFGVKTDPVNRTWFRLGVANDSVWVAFDSTGRAIGKLALPFNRAQHFQVLRFGRDYVLATYYDEDGARRVVRYALEPVR